MNSVRESPRGNYNKRHPMANGVVTWENPEIFKQLWKFPGLIKHSCTYQFLELCTYQFLELCDSKIVNLL